MIYLRKRKHLCLFSLLLVLLINLSASYSEGKMAEKNEKNLPGFQEYCDDANNKIAVLTIEHIGAIDKPIVTLILKTNLASKLPMVEEAEMVREVEISENEMKCICTAIFEGKLVFKKNNLPSGFGSFSYKFKRENAEDIVWTKRADSINVFKKMNKCVKNNKTVKQLIENTIKRIGGVAR